METPTRNTYALLNAHHLLLRELYRQLLFARPVDLREIAEEVSRKIKNDARLPADPDAAAEALEIRPLIQEIVENFFQTVAVDTQFP
jgi:hypothetical protein